MSENSQDEAVRLAKLEGIRIGRATPSRGDGIRDAVGLFTLLAIGVLVGTTAVGIMLKHGEGRVERMIDRIERMSLHGSGVSIDPTARGLAGVQLGSLKLSDLVYDKATVDELISSSHSTVDLSGYYTSEQTDGIVGSLASVTARQDPVFADDADWTVETTEYETEVNGMQWSAYSFLVRMEDGASTNGTVTVRSHDGEARYARQFNLVAASATARDGSEIAVISGNSLLPTGAGSGTALVDVTYGGRTKTVPVGVHPIYRKAQNEPDVSAQQAKPRVSRRELLERARPEKTEQN